MTVTYADTSALARCYLPGEPDDAALRSQLFATAEVVVISELATIDLASAVTAAVRAHRLRRGEPTLRRFRHDLAGEALTLIPITDVIVHLAVALVERRALYTLDALHLATALDLRGALAPDDDLVFVTRDRAQASAARAEGLAVE